MVFDCTVVPDGFGLAYAIGNDYIRWTITSARGDGAVLKHYLAEAATEVRVMMERAAAAAEKKRGTTVEARSKL